MVKISPSTAGGLGLIPGQRTKILHALWPENQKERKKEKSIKQKQCFNKFNKDYKHDPHGKKSFKINK